MSLPKRVYSCTRGFLRPAQRIDHIIVRPWKPKTNPDQHRPLCPQLRPSGRQLHCCGFSAWSLLGPNPNHNHNPQPNPNTISNLTLHLTRTIAWALTSALEGDHETGVPSALATTLDQTLTLAKALSPWGSNQSLTTPDAWGPEAVQEHSA